jgi:predicted transcriptional regulator
MPKRKPQIRAYVDEHTDKLLKALAGVMDSSVNAIVVEAIEQWLSKPEIQEKIEKHRLDELD